MAKKVTVQFYSIGAASVWDQVWEMPIKLQAPDKYICKCYYEPMNYW